MKNARTPTNAWGARIAIALLALVGLLWLIWSAWFHSRPALTFNEVAFTISSKTAGEIRYEVTRREPSKPVICVLRALDASGQVVGELRESIPGERDLKASPTAARRTVVTTLSQAAFIRVDRCWVSG